MSDKFRGRCNILKFGNKKNETVISFFVIKIIKFL